MKRSEAEKLARKFDGEVHRMAGELALDLMLPLFETQSLALNANMPEALTWAVQMEALGLTIAALTYTHGQGRPAAVAAMRAAFERYLPQCYLRGDMDYAEFTSKAEPA